VTPQRIKYPPLPKEVEGPGGTVTVICTKAGIKHENAECWGLYDSEARTITIDMRAKPRQRWLTFYHELVHVALIDAGLNNGIPDQLHEAICDAVATARMRERFG
jgi:Zn-dependent peptidase ImmA (M78 family)